MGVVIDDAISQLEQIRIVVVCLLMLLPSMGPKWPRSHPPTSHNPTLSASKQWIVPTDKNLSKVESKGKVE